MISVYKKLIPCAVGLLFAFTANAQVVEGTIKDAKTGETLPYVNVGIVGKGIGTVTNVDGKFKLDLKGSTADTLKLSMIGYKSQAFITGSYSSGKVVSLQPDVVNLKEVKVKPKKWKTALLGNQTSSKSGNAGFTSNKLGNEIGTIIKIKKSPTLIKKFYANVATAPRDSVKMRLNFYSVKDGLPDQLLNTQNIFVTLKKDQEQVVIDLEPYNIVAEDKFVVTLEWIENARGQGVHFSASFFKGPIIARETSQAGWEKVGMFGLGFYVLAEY
ncbi:MAG: carboxypeptidase-like regulatory domain-containing protein [Sphingobacteriaceae bacterium]|nr:MAG: carboxypeptidase-like regulatory domain-containing protein [Sphingobacteriaceae bacterium]